MHGLFRKPFAGRRSRKEGNPLKHVHNGTHPANTIKIVDQDMPFDRQSCISQLKFDYLCCLTRLDQRFSAAAASRPRPAGRGGCRCPELGSGNAGLGSGAGDVLGWVRTHRIRPPLPGNGRRGTAGRGPRLRYSGWYRGHPRDAGRRCPDRRPVTPPSPDLPVPLSEQPGRRHSARARPAPAPGRRAPAAAAYAARTPA